MQVEGGRVEKGKGEVWKTGMEKWHDAELQKEEEEEWKSCWWMEGGRERREGRRRQRRQEGKN